MSDSKLVERLRAFGGKRRQIADMAEGSVLAAHHDAVAGLAQEAAAALEAAEEALEPFAAFLDGLELLTGPSACPPGCDFYVLENSKTGRRAIGRDDFEAARSAYALIRGEKTHG